MTDCILILNVGSSSIKFALFPLTGDLPALLRGKIAGIGTAPVFTAHDHRHRAVPEADVMPVSAEADYDALIPAVLTWLQATMPDLTITAVGHRVVHGGRGYTGPALVTPMVLADLARLIPLAPLHQPHNLAGIACITAALPNVKQVVCFDTSFHRTQDDLAQMFALPRDLTDAGIIRYGFHGLSYAYIADVLYDHIGERANGRVVVAHLGNGASMCAMTHCRSVATSMGFTALDGLVMAQRCGSLDPGVVLYLMQQMGLTAAQVSTLLYTQSGLLGVSDISSDMAVLEASTAPAAQEAITLFCDRAAGELASLCTANGGLDTIVFTAGIGEKSAKVREMICDRLAWLGVELDPQMNARHATCISAHTSPVDVLLIPTDEEIIIADAARWLIEPKKGGT